MERNQRLSPIETQVAAKVIDGEAIIIRLSDGFYFSMSHVGALVWSLIEQRMTVNEIVSEVLARYHASEAQVLGDVVDLANQLLREELVQTVTSGPDSSEGAEGPLAEAKEAYESPRLQQYQDMADLLALDPPAPGLTNVAWNDPGEE